MGTNYYFEVKNVDNIVNQIKQLNNIIPEELLKRIKGELTNIHIGKSSGGWRALFEVNEYFSSMKELKEFYQNNKEQLIIKDEYNRELTWKELEEWLIKSKGGSHITDANINGYNTDGRYFKDEEGFEWLRNEFS